MSDLEGLKERIELINARLQTAHQTRERESTALAEIWEQIRDRYLDQRSEIATMREHIEGLEETKIELTELIQVLLSAVETNLSQATDETVPKIRGMADTLLSGETEIVPPEHIGDKSVDTGSGNEAETDAAEDLIAAIEESLENEDVIAHDESQIPESVPETIEPISSKMDQSVSPGIRDLIGRIEDAVGPVTYAGDEDNDVYSNSDENLGQDLKEIEELRSELMGLRERMASNG
tara:strand:- start:22357 stop:23064 length:708 start_codon:yes stop_codon:yes gene_type:complete